jgi:hypothetical protein
VFRRIGGRDKAGLTFTDLFYQQTKVAKANITYDKFFKPFFNLRESKKKYKYSFWPRQNE